MTRPEPQHFTANLFALLQETFEEGGSYYLDKGAGLFPTLEAITPEVASRSPWDGAPSIAAHCAHLGYYLRANHNAIVGREQPLDWPSSWQVQRVGAAEWEALRSQLRLEYDELRASLNTLPAWSDAAVNRQSRHRRAHGLSPRRDPPDQAVAAGADAALHRGARDAAQLVARDR